ncbi:hypothetical protein [Dyella caseinilytica]|uniref:DUF4340 domain-containing protein n=1 Tax=Dyella caseinilytica TaxID=1849581 RepID=A0ABX7GVH2_9GAMM|nr:hypothetical protein [Dyella caseinilytica]QRN54016.1 hypothetical protein ISN74_00990 [Dyella caseinilytica]GFZ90902.1 hypothetical protein GCM10011408_07680 [Dyella caseinilytica]
MKRAARRQLWLLAAVIVLVAAAWWQLHSDQLAAPGTLLPIKPDAITRVDLQMGNAPAEHYVKRGDHWWHVDETASVRADDLRLSELVHIAAAPVQSWEQANNYDATKIGLSPPQAKLDLDGQTINFGGMTAVGQNAYVRVGERVGIVSLRYMPRSAQSQNIKAE